MFVHELKAEISEVRGNIRYLEDIIGTLKNNNMELPVGRPRDFAGHDKYDDASGYGPYKSAKSDNILYGEYMAIGNENYRCSDKEMEKYENELLQKNKRLQQLEKQLEKAEKKVQKSPAEKSDGNYTMNFEELWYADIEKLSREELEGVLKQVEDNHSFIQENTQLVAQSNSLLGKIKRLLGSKKVLGYGDMQKRAEQIDRAIHKENSFIRTKVSGNDKTYENALNMFKYGSISGPETISINEDYGPHDDYTREVDQVTLEQFDYICSPVGKKLHGIGSISKEKYDKLVEELGEEKDKTVKDDFSKELEGLINDEVSIGEANKNIESKKDIKIDSKSQDDLDQQI